jgi:hypothetical protein
MLKALQMMLQPIIMDVISPDQSAFSANVFYFG